MLRRRGDRSSPSSENSVETEKVWKRALFIISPFVVLFIIFRVSTSTFTTQNESEKLVRDIKRQRVGAALAQTGTTLLNLNSFSNFSDPPPFPFCPTFGTTDRLRTLHGKENILKTRLHVGSNARIQRVIKRALAGYPITMAVLGGSISSCHGLDSDEDHPLGNPLGVNCYPHRIFDWFNTIFPHPANELTNGAIRRTGTSYFGYCSGMHLPDRVDLVILEFDTQDPNDRSSVATMDLLVRSILLRPDEPAVIMLGHFSPQYQGEFGFGGPEIWHTAVAQYYDVVHLSLKGLLYERYILNQSKIRSAFYLDPILPNMKGHELLADTVIAFLESEVCSYWEASALETDIGFYGEASVQGYSTGEQEELVGSGNSEKKGQANTSQGEDHNPQPLKEGSKKAMQHNIPPLRIMHVPHERQEFREVSPYCASANNMVNPLAPSVLEGSGWVHVEPEPNMEDQQHYWESTVAGSVLRIPVKCVAGDIAVYYYRGPRSQNWGNVLCWVDDNSEAAAELKGGWDQGYGQPTVVQIDQDVGAGNHVVSCELQGQKGQEVTFRLFGVFST